MPAARKKKAGAGASRARERELALKRLAAVEVGERADVCVIGGGAAGLACAIAAAEAGSRVVVLERDLECGRTILATGNGRCNFANADLSAEHYNQPEFVTKVMGPADGALEFVQDFFARCGLASVCEEGRLYPRSRQAGSVRNVLLARAERAGVVFACGREVIGAARVSVADDEPCCADAGDGVAAPGDGACETCADKAATCDDMANPGACAAALAAPAHQGGPAACAGGLSHEAWEVSFAQAWDGRSSTLVAESLVFAGGGASHALAGELGLPLVADEPVLCALAAQGPVPGMLEALDGRRAHCVASLTRGGRVVHREAGEVLFRTYGVSGIVSFDLSRHVRPGDMLELDLAPEVDAWEVDKLVAARPGDAHALDGILDPAIAAELIKLAGGASFGGLAWRVAPLVKGLPLRVSGRADEARAQVTRGGISVDACDAATLAIDDMPGMFGCGEALDVDGACGGYNLAWAWVSGILAGHAAHAHAQAIARVVAQLKAAARAAAAENAGDAAGLDVAVGPDDAAGPDVATRAADAADGSSTDDAEVAASAPAEACGRCARSAAERGNAC